jgi:hypothetical protein
MKYGEVMAASHMGEERNIYKDLVREPERKKPFGRPRRRREDNTKIDLKEIGCESVDWTHLAQGRDQLQVLVNTVMDLWVPLSAEKFVIGALSF